MMLPLFSGIYIQLLQSSLHATHSHSEIWGLAFINIILDSKQLLQSTATRNHKKGPGLKGWLRETN